MPRLSLPAPKYFATRQEDNRLSRNAPDCFCLETSASRVRCNAPLFNFMSVLSSHKLLYSLPATLPSTCAGERRRRKIAFPDPGKESMACSFSKWIRVPHCRSCRARSRLKEGLASSVVGRLLPTRRRLDSLESCPSSERSPSDPECAEGSEPVQRFQVVLYNRKARTTSSL